MLEIPEKLFNIDVNDIEVGLSEFHMYRKDEIEEAQAGYRYDELTGEPIEDWIGEEYIVIGNDSCCGDPIIAKIDEDELPIYSMFYDDWSSLQMISNSLEQFVNILKKLDKTECKKIFEEIKKEVPSMSFDYWEGLIAVTYEFLTNDKYWEETQKNFIRGKKEKEEF